MKVLNRLGLEAVVVVALLVGVAAILGPPDVPHAVQFFNRQAPTASATVALASAIVWLAATSIAVLWLLIEVRRARRGRESFRRLSAVAVLLGMTALGLGVAKHSSVEYRQCCGSLQRATQALEEARP